MPASGRYDNDGYRLRGHQFTDQAGRYVLETVIPGSYAGRTPHIHVKIQAPNRPMLTTQLFLPNDSRNRSDPFYRPELLMQLRETAGGKEAHFDFVMESRR